jgi:hypothetical protein
MFIESPELDVRENHLRATHKLRACANKPDIYYDTDRFHDHLEIVQNATISRWSRKLLRACAVGNRPGGIVNETESVATHGDRWQDVDETAATAVEEWEDTPLQTTGEEWEDTPLQTTGEAFVPGLWDSALLGE